MEDVLDVYAATLRCQAASGLSGREPARSCTARPRGSLPLEPGQPERQDYEYERHGVCNLFLAVEPLTRLAQGAGHRPPHGAGLCRATARPGRRRLSDADSDRPGHRQSEHAHPSLPVRALRAGQARRIAAKLEWHYTPEHGSWLNIAECELSVLAGSASDRRIPDKAALIREVAAWEARATPLTSASTGSSRRRCTHQAQASVSSSKRAEFRPNKALALPRKNGEGTARSVAGHDHDPPVAAEAFQAIQGGVDGPRLQGHGTGDYARQVEHAAPGQVRSNGSSWPGGPKRR